MGRFTGNPFSTENMGVDLYTDFDELRKEREKMDQEIIEWSKTLQPDWLNSEITFTSKVDNKTRVMPRWAAVTQMFNQPINRINAPHSSNNLVMNRNYRHPLASGI